MSKRRRTRRRPNGLFGCDRKRVTHRSRSLVRGKLRTTSERVTITNGRRKSTRRCRNPAAARAPRSLGQAISGVKILPWGEARKTPGYAAALRSFRRFHGAAPIHATRVRIADGRRAVTRRAVMLIGESPSLEYQVWKHGVSNKAGKKGQKIIWRHRNGEGGGKKPLLVYDPATRMTSHVGGTLRVDDWLRH